MDRFIGKRLDGRYEIHELIGMGGMAYVYRAYDKVEDRWVAIKILKEEFSENSDFLRRFRNESKAIAVLSHPNIVKVYDVSFGDQIQYIVMEYIDGITLKEYIGQQGTIRWNEAVHFMIQILRALEHAHEKRIIHRDIKPQNILLLQDGTIKVTDFGIARFLQNETQTMTDKAIGSVHYISPEQARGDHITDKADIYSTGVMLYEMLTGKLPFVSDTAVSVALMQLQTKPVSPREINPSIPKGLEQVTLKAMEKNPIDRFDSAAEMRIDVERFRQNPNLIFDYEQGTTQNYDARRNMNTYEDIRSTAAPSYNDSYEYEEELVRSKKRAKTSMAITGVVVGVIIIAIVFGAIYLLDAWKNQENTEQTDYPVPDFIGKDYQEEVLGNTEYTTNFVIESKEGNNPDYPAGAVVYQDPKAGMNVKKGTKIVLSVNGSIEKVGVPELKDYEQAEAVNTLTQMKLKYKIETISDDNIKSGYVVKTDPAAATEVDAGTVVTLFVSKGSAVKQVNVPDGLVGDLLYNVTSKLEDAGLVVGNISYDDESTLDKDRVVSTSPKSGEKISEGSSLDLVVSTGKGATKTLERAIQLPGGVDEDLSVKVYRDATLVSTEIINPQYLSTYTLNFSGTTGIEKIVVKLNDQEYMFLDFDYDLQEVTVTQQNPYVPTPPDPTPEPEPDPTPEPPTEEDDDETGGE